MNRLIISIFVYCLVACSKEKATTLNIYFNTSRSIDLKRFNLKIMHDTTVLFDTVLHTSTADSYKQIGLIKVKKNETYIVSVNDLDSVVKITDSYKDIFIAYKDYFLPSEKDFNTGNSEISFDKKSHKLLLKLKK